MADNYGPVFTTTKKKWERWYIVKLAKEIYWFSRECLLCRQDWPIIEEMPKDPAKFPYTPSPL